MIQPNKTAILVLTHKPMPYIKLLATNKKNINFYIHIDKKIKAETIISDFSELDNVFFIQNRIEINWAGYSMIKATLALIECALLNKENNTFHLISADDVLLQPVEEIDNAWQETKPDAIYLDVQRSPKHRYRLRFNAPHADTSYQRHPLGKAFTLCLKLADKILPNGKDSSDLFGSQWFSIRRPQLQILIDSISSQDKAFFAKKLCPDEHFFQYIVTRTPALKLHLAESNQRYIVFDPAYHRGAHPVFLSLSELQSAQKKGAWFARKVDSQLASTALNLISKSMP